jgi:hypothetical protein
MGVFATAAVAPTVGVFGVVVAAELSLPQAVRAMLNIKSATNASNRVFMLFSPPLNSMRQYSSITYACEDWPHADYRHLF